jgi:conjugal transfer/entry exclusion protein
MSWLSEFLHPGRAYEEANKSLNQTQGQLQNLTNQAQNAVSPYAGYGTSVWPQMNDVMKNLLNPQALQDKWASGYKESEAAKNLENMATQRGLNSMSSQGVLGSTPALQAMQAGSAQIAAEDRQQYLNDLMQKYLAGAGIAQNIFGTGANAAGQMSNNYMNLAGLTSGLGQQQAGLTYGQNSAGGNMLANLLGAGFGLAGSALGGPIGGALSKRWNLGGG